MKCFMLFIVCLLLICPAMAMADVIYVSGDQTGTWSADTVIVTAEVRVLPEQSLTILPGVGVLFQVYCKLIVDSAATLLAVGTAADSIRFDVLSPDSNWHGIRFLSASDSSRLEYCHLTHGYATGGGEDSQGGAIYCASSSPTTSHNTISGNFSILGGGILCRSDLNPTIIGNTIRGNSADAGGGICRVRSSPTINDNIISGNNVVFSGGGIPCSGTATIVGNSINGNSVMYHGGGSYCWGTPTIGGNTISGNSTSTDGGGIYADSGAALVNCILWGNSPRQITGSPLVTYSDVQDTIWPGEGNISVDPLFVYPANGDFHLMAVAWGDSVDSPCIDAGDPNILDSLLDCSWGRGGARSDMGAYGGGDSLIIEIGESKSGIPKKFMLSQNFPNPFNAQTANKYSLSGQSLVTIDIFDILGLKVETLDQGMKPAGNHQAT